MSPPTLRQTLDSDFFTFCHVLFPDTFRVHEAYFHREIIAKALTTQLYACAAPREHGKSVLFSVLFPLWLMLSGRRRYVVLLSSNSRMASDYLEIIKIELETNEKLIRIYGAQKTRMWSRQTVQLVNGARIVARGIFTGVRGLLARKGARPDQVIVDDCETDRSAISQTQIDRILGIITRAVVSLGKTCCVVVIGTLLSSQSVLSKLTDRVKYPQWQGDVFAARDKAHRPIWPAWWDDAQLQARERQVGPIAWLTEYMNQPHGAGMTPFKYQYIADNTVDQIPPAVLVGIALDPSTGKGADEYGLVGAAFCADKNFYVFFVEGGKLEFDYMVKRVLALAHEKAGANGKPVQFLEVESVAYQTSLVQHLRPLLPITVIERNQSVAKSLRITALDPYFSNGKIKFYRPMLDSPAGAEFVKEIINWRPDADFQEHRLDALEMIISRLAKMAGVSSQVPRRNVQTLKLVA